jgi:hypothetical protein
VLKKPLKNVFGRLELLTVYLTHLERYDAIIPTQNILILCISIHIGKYILCARAVAVNEDTNYTGVLKSDYEVGWVGIGTVAIVLLRFIVEKMTKN